MALKLAPWIRWLLLLLFVAKHSCESESHIGITTNADSNGYIVINLGDDFYIQCNVSSAPDNQSVSVNWFKEDGTGTGTELHSNENRTVHVDNNSVTFKRATVKDGGVYRCELNVTESADSARIEVRAKPRVYEFPKSYNHVQGERLFLECKADGVPKPNVTWLINGENATGDSFSRVEIKIINTPENEGQARSTLTIKELQEEDRAQYECVAQNEHGNDTSQVLVRVKDKLAALWPFLGIVAEVAVLCTIIFIYEKRRAKQEFEESDTDQSPDTKNVAENKDKDLRQRK